ncbi:hypothetical protein ACFWBS_58795 [Streptomyces mirabilis]|uniref:hypothetical protein n=1 Tax=Streptomyces mirabilis TaxID=68239 RepID=UPI00365C367D
MRSNTTGAVSTPAAVSTEGTDELPQDVQRDVDLVAAGFTGPLWQQTADELYAYAFKPLLSAMRRTHKLADLCAKSATPLVITDEDRGTLYRSAPDRERLAIPAPGRDCLALRQDFHRRRARCEDRIRGARDTGLVRRADQRRVPGRWQQVRVHRRDAARHREVRRSGGGAT